MTIEVDFSTHKVCVPSPREEEEGAEVEMFLFDCAGQGIFNALDMNSPHVTLSYL